MTFSAGTHPRNGSISRAAQLTANFLALQQKVLIMERRSTIVARGD
jgi:hypothetical protein